MAALLHTDHEDKALISALITASGLPAKRLAEPLPQLVFIALIARVFAYDLVFMPHGENLILVLDEYVPGQDFNERHRRRSRGTQWHLAAA